LALGELMRTVMRRRIDWPVWFAFAAAVVPVLGFAKVIARARAYADHFWAAPRWEDIPKWYLAAFGLSMGLPIALSALAALRLSIPQARWSVRSRPIKLWQAAAIVSISLLPAIGMLIGKYVTNAFTYRYAIAAFPAVCILLTIGYSRLFCYRSSAAALVWLCALAFFAATALRQTNRQRGELAELRQTASFLRANSVGAPIVVANRTRFHRLSYYAPRELGSRVVFLADPHLSLQYLGSDSTERGMLELNPWFPLNVRWFYE